MRTCLLSFLSAAALYGLQSFSMWLAMRWRILTMLFDPPESMLSGLCFETLGLRLPLNQRLSSLRSSWDELGVALWFWSSWLVWHWTHLWTAGVDRPSTDACLGIANIFLCWTEGLEPVNDVRTPSVRYQASKLGLSAA